MPETISFQSILKVAQGIASLLNPAFKSPARCMPALTHIRVQMAAKILGISAYQDSETQETSWDLSNLEKLRLRLKKAGINAETWQIVDRRAASWAWHQLRSTKKFSERHQAVLVNNGQEPPDIDVPCRVVPELKEPHKIIFEQQQSTSKHFQQEITEHLMEKGIGPRKGIGL